MEDQLVATTRDIDLQPLGIGGQPAVLAWHQLAGYLARTLGAGHAALFAEPNPNPGRGETEWYARVAAPAVPLASLPRAEQDAARAELERLVAGIRAEAGRLSTSQRPDDRFMGGLLHVALSFPGEEHVRVAAGRPVLVAWAHEAASRTGGQVALVSARELGAAGAGGARAAGEPAAPARETPPRGTGHARQWPGRAGAGALLGVLGIAALVAILAAFLMSGREPGPAPVAGPALPAARWAAGDLSLLEGCWTLGAPTQATYSAGAHRETCEVDAGRICFGADGKGTRESNMTCPTPGRVTCAAPVEARFADGAVATRQPRVTCTPSDTSWEADELACRRVNDDLARCTDKAGFPYDFVAGRPSR
jgi:hypothetical protein